MSETWLVVDCSSLCYKHAYGLIRKGPLDAYGFRLSFFMEIDALAHKYAARSLVFCWDVGRSRERQRLDARYKATRGKPTGDAKAIAKQKAVRLFVIKQARALRLEVVPTIGFTNNLWHRGFEADDMIALAVRAISGLGDNAIIVSSDNDLLQCVKSSVSFVSSRDGGRTTCQSFFKKYGVLTTNWAMVKAVAGCTSDNVIGIRGVGEHTAIKYIRGELPPESKKLGDILAGLDTIQDNLALVQLPMIGAEMNALLTPDTKALKRRWLRRMRKAIS